MTNSCSPFLRNFILMASTVLLVILYGSLCSATLYDESDPIIQLNHTFFYRTVLETNSAFIVEFYNSWCGHCVRYAPQWKSIAKDLEMWNRVAKVAAVDCAEKQNSVICRDFDIQLFPTVKFFWPQMKKGDFGLVMEHNVDVPQMRVNLIALLESYSFKAPMNNWPRFNQISYPSISRLFEILPLHIKAVLIILEVNNSYIGREVMLDVSSLNVTVLRAIDSNHQLVTDLTKNSEVQIPHLPALLLINRKGNVNLLQVASDTQLARMEFRKAIFNLLRIHPEETKHRSKFKPAENFQAAENSVEHPEVLHMVDLENALRYLLRQEVTLKRTLEDEDLHAFKAFLAALSKTFPGSEFVMKFLHQLYAWAVPKNSIKIEDMVFVMDDLEHRQNIGIPALREYAHCRGSDPIYRGYPCGLWSLFHTMTVTAYQKYVKGDMVNPSQVLFAIRDYILRFFGCSECAEHFGKMAITMEKELRYPNDTVLWLWQGHNKVNRRLAGDKTEDPVHPKIQFPPKSLCRECYVRSSDEEENFNLSAVLSFIISFYSTSIIQGSSVSFSVHTNDILVDPNNQVGWRFKYFNRADVSLCLLLYISSAALLLIVYFIIMIRRKRRRLNCSV